MRVVVVASSASYEPSETHSERSGERRQQRTSQKRKLTAATLAIRTLSPRTSRYKRVATARGRRCEGEKSRRANHAPCDHASSSSPPTRLPSVGPTSPQNDQPRCESPAAASVCSASSSSPTGTLTPSSSIEGGGGGRFFSHDQAATVYTTKTAIATMARPAGRHSFSYDSVVSCGGKNARVLIHRVDSASVRTSPRITVNLLFRSCDEESA